MFAVQKEKLRIYLLFTLSATLCVTLGETAETVYGLIGKDVQLDPKVTETLSSITWKKENDKLAEWIRGRTVEYYGRCRTAGRCDLSKTTGVLIMKELNPGDTGKYSVDVNDLSSAKEFLLTVLGETAETVYGLIGKDFQLDPKVTETLSSITWKKQNDKLAEWIRGQTVDYYGRCLTAGPCDLSETTGVLIMKGLEPGDEWIYSAEINGKKSEEEFLLTVLEPVSKPTVTTSCSGTQCTLVCVGQETRFTKYTWKVNSKPVKEGHTLVVEKSGDRNKRYTCVLSNPVSQEDSDLVSEEDLFPEPVFKPTVTRSCSGTQCTLVCVGQETRFTKYTWKENNEPVKEGNTLVVEKSGDRHKRYTCVFSNPASQEDSDPVSEEDLFPDPPYGVIAGVIIGVIIIISLLIIIGVIYWSRKRLQNEIMELQQKVNKLESYEIKELQQKVNKLESYGDLLPEGKKVEYRAEIKNLHQKVNLQPYEIKELQQKVYKLQSHGDLLPEGKKVEYRAEIKELQLKVNKLHSYEIMKLQLKFNKLLSYGDQTSPEAHLLSCGPGEEVTET